MVVARALMRQRLLTKPSVYMREWQPACGAQGIPVQTGVFAAHMQVELLNDGPVTFVLDSRGAS